MESDPAPTPAESVAESQTQRVRVGMLGLAFVFLLVMLATALISVGRDAGDLIDNQASPTANDSAGETPREPLAELGVAPGNPPPPAPAPPKPSGGR